ncbi:MAG: hypothetical protein F6K41_15875 [Symploca sp. SIO3E6]|nr:hypothetical protein [Caldora sp. SIO3E6]
MTTLTLKLSPEIEEKLRSSLARGDAEAIRQLLAEAFTPTVAVLLQQASSCEKDIELDDEFEAIADRLANDFAASVSKDAPVLSDYALSRAGIYEDCP